MIENILKKISPYKRVCPVWHITKLVKRFPNLYYVLKSGPSKKDITHVIKILNNDR